jgi:ribosomal protein S18 acetylase RimI-like enzyme
VIVTRAATEADLEQLAVFEAEIASISFGDEAVTDPAQHIKKLRRAWEKGEDIMLVLADDEQVLGWLWVSLNTNMFTGDAYANFRSFILTPELRGSAWADTLFDAAMAEIKAEGDITRVVGKVHVDNVPMRLLYRKWGFVPQHLTMELALKQGDENDG